MGLASEQELALQKTEESGWTVRKLFPFAAATGAFAKTFINVFDVLLGFVIVTLGIGELLGRDISWGLYALTIPLLVAAFAERHFEDIKGAKKHESTGK